MRTPLCDPTYQSKKWLVYFLMNRLTARGMPWHDETELTPQELAAITKSIQQFQLGEGSNGKRLLKRGEEHAQATNDPAFATALALFVKEEQRHSLYLARFMQIQGIPPLPSHWVDTVFRKLRGLAGLELSLTVLVTAELIAVPYYRALRDATHSILLGAISSKILEDEAAHLQYQASMLSRLAPGRSPFRHRLLGNLHRLFLLGTIVLVWLEHGKVFHAGNYDFNRFKNETLHCFREWGFSRRTWISRPAVVGSAESIPWGEIQGVERRGGRGMLVRRTG